MSKSLWRVSIVTVAQAEDAVAELLGDVLGQSCSAYHDFETGRTTVSVFLADQSPFQLGRQRILQGLCVIRKSGLTSTRPRMTCKRIRQEDWAESWKRHFKPLEIGRKLLIKPSWSRRRPKRGQAVVVLDPGLSFGTGHHPTTAFCLKEIARVADKGKPRQGLTVARSSIHQSINPLIRGPKGWTPSRGFLDAGTGSGILAIAAAKLGFSPVEAFDFDPDALQVARRNAKRNRAAARIRFFQENAIKFRTERKYSIICANLSRDVLDRAIGRLVACLEHGGLIVLAGILTSEFSSIVHLARERGLVLLRRRDQKEWSSGAFANGL